MELKIQSPKNHILWTNPLTNVEIYANKLTPTGSTIKLYILSKKIN